MASIQEIVARRSPVASLPQASPNPNTGVGITSDAGSGGFRQLGQVRGIPLNTATGFGEAGMIDAESVGAIGQTIGQIATAVDELNEANEKARLSNAISLADAKLKEWNSISDPELKKEFGLKQLQPAYNDISTERKSLRPIAANARTILDSEKNVLLNADLANKSTSNSMVELFKLEENIIKAKDLNEFSAGSQRYTAHVYSMLDSGLLTVAQSTSIMNRSRTFLSSQETFQLESAYGNGIKNLSTKEILTANKILEKGDYVFPKGHLLRPVEEFLDKTPSSRSNTVSRLLKGHLEGIEIGNKKYEAEETASYRRAVEQDFPELREGLDNIISQNLTTRATFKKIKELTDPISKKHERNVKVINRLKLLKNDTIRNADLIKKANDSDLLDSINGFLNERDKDGNTFGELLSEGKVRTIDGIFEIIKEHPNLKERFEVLTRESLFDNNLILNRMQSELLKGGSVYNDFVDAYTNDRKQILEDANKKYKVNYKGLNYNKQKKLDAISAELIRRSTKTTDNVEFRKQANEFIDGELLIFGTGQPRKVPEDFAVEIEVANIVGKAIKASIPKKYESLIDVADLSKLKENKPVAILNKKGKKYFKGLNRPQQKTAIRELNEFTAKTKQIVESATSPNQLNIPGPVTRGDVQVGDKAFAMESIYDSKGQRFDLPEAKPRQAPIDELKDQNRAEYIESGKQPFDMSTSKVLDSLSEFRKENPQEYAAIEQLAISRDQLEGPQKSQMDYIGENISEAFNTLGENALNLLPKEAKKYVKGLVDFWSNAITPLSQGVSEAGATESSNPAVRPFDSDAKKIDLPKMAPRTPTKADLTTLRAGDTLDLGDNKVRTVISGGNKINKESVVTPAKLTEYKDSEAWKDEFSIEVDGQPVILDEKTKSFLKTAGEFILKKEGHVEGVYLDKVASPPVITAGAGLTGAEMFGEGSLMNKFVKTLPKYLQKVKNSIRLFDSMTPDQKTSVLSLTFNAGSIGPETIKALNKYLELKNKKASGKEISKALDNLKLQWINRYDLKQKPPQGKKKVPLRGRREAEFKMFFGEELPDKEEIIKRVNEDKAQKIESAANRKTQVAIKAGHRSFKKEKDK